MVARKKTQGTRSLLREMIFSGRFRPGTFLPSIRDLSAELDIPKSTIHEILKMLQIEGLIQLQPQKRGALVLDHKAHKNQLFKVALRTADFGFFGGRQETSQMLVGVCAAAERRYIDVILSFSDSENIYNEISSLYQKNTIQGVVLLGCKTYDLSIKPLEAMNIPYVLVNNVYGLDVTGCVQDFYGIAQRAVKYLYKHGHTKIGILNGTTKEHIYKESLRGFKDALAGHGLAFNKTWNKELKSFSRGTHHVKKLIKMLEAGDYPTAFFTVRDYRAKYIYEACNAVGLKIPENISVISYDNINWDEAPGRGLTTFQEPAFDLGENAMNMLKEWVVTKIRPANTLVKAPLIERGSVANI